MLTSITGSDCCRPFDSWRNVCACDCRKRQDHSLRRNRTPRISPRLHVAWQPLQCCSQSTWKCITSSGLPSYPQKWVFYDVSVFILNIPPLQQVSDSGRIHSIKSSVGNFTIPAYLKFSIPLRPEWQNLKLWNVPMVIFVEQYMGLGHISLTIRNKFGCRGLFKGGVQSVSHLSYAYFHYWEVTPLQDVLRNPTSLMMQAHAAERMRKPSYCLTPSIPEYCGMILGYEVMWWWVNYHRNYFDTLFLNLTVW